MGDHEVELTKRHPAIQQLLRWFICPHLPPHLFDVSERFRVLAFHCADAGDGPEVSAALRNLLIAKDAAVRSVIAKMEAEAPQGSGEGGKSD